MQPRAKQADVFFWAHFSLLGLVGLWYQHYHRRRLVIGARCGLFNTYN